MIEMSKEPDLMTAEEGYQPRQIISTSNERPFISVVIDGFMRKEFIIEAVNSVRNQDLNENAFELIVLRAFDDIELDKQLTQNKAKIIDIKAMSIGEAIAFAVEKSIGEVICFLDDDDMFMPSKLSKIESIFSSNPDLVYCHNSQVYCDENSNLVSGFKMKGIKNIDISFTNRGLKSALKHLRSSKINPGSLYFNFSSISVRRKVLLSKLSVIKKITGHTDNLVFFLALSTEKEVRLLNISDALTVYRIHNSATNIVQRVPNIVVREFRIKQLSDYVHSSRIISEIMQEPEGHTLAVSFLTYDNTSLYNVKKEYKKLIMETVKLLTKGYLKKIECNLNKRMIIYTSFFSFALFYALSKRFPFLWKLSFVFPEVESFKQ